MVWLVVTGFIAAIIIQIIVFSRKKQFMELFVNVGLMTLALLYAISGLTQWKLPLPGEFFVMIFKPISDIVFKNHPDQ